MALAKILAVALMLGLTTAQYTVDPPTKAPDDTIKDCTNWLVATKSDTCQSIANDNGLALEQIYRWNPSLASGCKLVVDTSYCIEENWGIPPPPTSTSSSTKASSTTGNGITTPTPTQSGGLIASCNNSTSGNGVATPTPTQDGMAPNCAKFHFVEPGTGCGDILSKYGISLASFYEWNKSVGPQCTGMWANVNVCVGLIGGATSNSASPSTTRTSSTTTGNGISTPTPTMGGMIADCDKFDFVKDGDACSAVLARNSLTVALLYAWNRDVKADCTGLWANVYVCVHKKGYVMPSSTLKTSSTTTGNGIPTPTPTMTGMVNNCKKFYKVVENDNCDKIASKSGAVKADIIKWNGLTTSCSVWLDYYICVGV
ncbi:uncharacterized protein B0I36DRAFT_420788 [Microdochium trichocladiopsis]|uniref:LysM domain-containing protein n=1 Tax=Microdochium trichocladiopsis TaxID=1682393 RepID=A0A9P9BUL5_9PEZI|nr:uncharacterized protein B0I36DRAFT_420788 [Microdochium trichocladiopsis]KAH7038277.1 hypothetical protein B0I36DRAFT_420788 [Microdochium trichocladiopsis]